MFNWFSEPSCLDKTKRLGRYVFQLTRYLLICSFDGSWKTLTFPLTCTNGPSTPSLWGKNW